MNIENISTLKIQKLTQKQFETGMKNDTLDNNSIYLTPTNLQGYALKSDLQTKADLVDGKVPLDQLPDNIGSGGGASSWNDLKDKPFEEISPAQTITWDGNTDGLLSTSIDLDMGEGNILTFACYKISDIIVTEELIKGTSFDCTTPDGLLSCEVDMVSGKTPNGSFYATNSQIEIPFIYVVNQANDSVIYNGDPTFTLVFPETGVWFLKGTVESSVLMQTNSLAVSAVIKTLDPKYIADMYYDTRIRSYYSYTENPNPVSFDCIPMNYSFYKVSDLVPTKEEILGAKITIGNRNLAKFSDSNIIIETDELILVQALEYTNDYAFVICNTVGTCPFTFMGYSLSVDVPEVGIYRINILGAGMSDVSTIEIFVSGELKTLDSKYIADMYYDTRKIYHFDSNKTPNPPSFSVAAFGVNGYKVFDLIPTLEEFFDYKIIYNNDFSSSTTEITFTNKQIQLSWDGAWMIQSDQDYTFALCHRAGTFESDYQGISIACEVPEPGIYLIWSAPPVNMTLEINLGGELKQIDPKFIPANLDFNLDDYYTKNETNNIINNNLNNYYTKTQTNNTINNNLNNYYTKNEIDIALKEKANDILLDSSPIQGSKNPIESGGVFAALEDLENKVTSAFYYKGTKENYSDLPLEGNSIGDIWNVANADPSNNIESGDNVAWDGTGWDVLAGVMDLSDYYTKTEIDNLYDFDSSDYYTKDQVDQKTDKSNYYTKAEVDNIALSGEVNLSNYYTKNEVYTKSEVYNKSEVDNAFKIKEIPWENVQNKPFGEEVFSITWDGNRSGKTLVSNTLTLPFIGFVKISDEPLPVDSVLSGGQACIQDLQGNKNYSDLTSEDYNILSNNISLIQEGTLVNVLGGDTVTIWGNTYTFSTKGIYLLAFFINSLMQADNYVSSGELKMLKQIDPKFIPADLDFNLDDYYTKADADSRYYTQSDINDNYYTKTEMINSFYQKNQTYTKDEVNSAINNINANLKNYYTKTEVDNIFNTSYYTKTEVDSTIDNHGYTKAQIDTMIGDINAIIGDADIVLNEINNLIGE